ncbi:MAG: hypothetical protein Q9160_003996 [Pyrenula sp. 1 TL-2023]
MTATRGSKELRYSMRRLERDVQRAIENANDCRSTPHELSSQSRDVIIPTIGFVGYVELECTRCVKSNLDCSYEGPNPYKAPPKVQPSNQFRRLIFYGIPSTKRFGNAREERAFNFFRQCTLTPVGMGLGWSSWGIMVLQNSEADSTLRHAVVALGALHEKIVRPWHDKTPDERQHTTFAYGEYHKSIMQLREKLLTSQKKLLESITLSCMLLTIFDFGHGDDLSGIAHLRGGLTLLRMFLNDSPLLQPKTQASLIWRFDESDSEQNFTASSLQQQFYHPLIYAYAWMDLWSSAWFDVECSFPEVTVLRGLQVQLRDPGDDGLNEVDRHCENLAALERRARELLRTVDAVNMQPEQARNLAPFSALKEDLIKKLGDWHRSCESLLAQEQLDALHRHRLLVAMMNNHKIWIALMACEANSTTSRDYQPYTQNFELILSMAAEALETAPTLSRPVDTAPFVVGDGIIHALYLTAVKCSDPIISAKAIGLLESRQWREGAWDSSAMAKIARRVAGV